MSDIVKNDDGSKPFCSICRVFLPIDSEKAIKQHLKSKPHKDAMRQPPKNEPTTAECQSSDNETATSTSNSSEEDPKCELCRMNARTRTRHTVEGYARALENGEDVEPCFPPPFVRSPKSLFPRCKTAFISLERLGWHQYIFLCTSVSTR